MFSIYKFVRGRILNNLSILIKEYYNNLLLYLKKLLTNNVFIITFIFIFLAMIFTYPIILNLDKIPIGLDHGQNIWNFWWFKKSLLELQLPTVYTDYIYYPYGVPLVFSTTTELNSLISIPLQTIFGLVETYNLILIFMFVLSGVSTFLLVRYLTKCKLSAFISAFIFAFSPYLIARIWGGHLNMLSVGWIPLYVLFLIKMFKEPCKKNVFFASLFLSFTCFSSWQYGIFMFVFTAFYLLYNIIFNRRKILNKKSIINFSLLVLFFFIITSPFLIPKISFIIDNPYRILKVHQAESNILSLDLLSPISPSQTQTISDFLPDYTMQYKYTTPWENTGYIGFTVIILMIISIFIFLKYKKKNTIGFWIFSFIMFFLLTLGSYLYIGGSEITIFGSSIPMPYNLFRDYFPLFSMGRGPSRFIVLVVLSASIIVGFGLREIFSKISTVFSEKKLISFERKLSNSLIKKFNKIKKIRYFKKYVFSNKDIKLGKYLLKHFSKFVKIIIFIFIIYLIFFEYSPKPITIADAPLSSKFYYTIAEDKEDYAIANFPGGVNALSMYYQTIHGKKIISGQVSRGFELKALYQENDAVYALYWKQLENYNTTKEDFICLKNLSIKYLILHKHAFWGKEGLELLDEYKNILNSIFDKVYFEDKNFLVYDIYELN